MVTFLQRLRSGLQRTRSQLGEKLSRLVLGKKNVDAELLDELESILITADVGVNVTEKIMRDLTARLSRHQLTDPAVLLQALKEDLIAILSVCEQPLVITPTAPPFVILVVGVNGSGKTTTLAKVANLLHEKTKKVLLAAGDTFRAAAIEQLQIWGKRIDIPVIAQHIGADSAAVIFDALEAAKARGMDVVVADTAGRLHTQSNLLEELKKVKRVIAKSHPSAPHEVLLVLDASIGQNAINQAEQFHQAMGVTGIALTKLDGTAKGGIIFAIAQKMQLPIRFIGVGEGIDDLKPFNAKEFVEALFT